jgi:hypothetical protein
MNPTPVTDPRARFWGNVAKWGILIPIGFFIAPFIWIALGGLFGLLCTIAFLVGVWMLRPVAFAFAANMRLKLIKAEAAKNPVETLQVELKRRMEALDQRKTAIGRLNGQIRTLGDKVDILTKKYGPKDEAVVKLKSQHKDLERVADNRETKWKQAYAMLQRFEQEIERASMIWDAAMAAAAAQETSGMTEEDFMAKLRTETSLDAIRNTFNDTLASLDTDLMQSDAERSATEEPPVSGKAQPA